MNYLSALIALALVSAAEAADPAVQQAIDAPANAAQQINQNLGPACAECVIPGVLKQRKPEKQKNSLFSSDQPLELTLSADFKGLNNLGYRQKDYKVPGQIEFIQNGVKKKMSVDFAIRGNFKQGACSSFKPLRLFFHEDESDREGTVFEGIKEDMKIATHCQDWGVIDDSSPYVQGMLREYTGYKALNAMGLMSLQVRLAHITYKDSQGATLAQASAFLLEPKGAMAKRFKEDNVKQNEALQFQKASPIEEIPYDIENHFMIDGDKFDNGSHNGILIAPKDSKKANAIVPYDYDLSQFAATPYSGYHEKQQPPNLENEKTWFESYFRSHSYGQDAPQQKAAVKTALQYVLKHKDAVLATIANSPVQDKTIMQQRAQNFFGGIEAFLAEPGNP